MKLNNSSFANQRFLLWDLSDLSSLSAQVGIKLKALSQSVSGVILNPQTNLDWSINLKAGLILPLDLGIKAQHDPNLPPTLIDSWGVAQIKNNYALASLNLYYHPQEEKALVKKQLLAELFDYCQHEGIDLLLNLYRFTPANLSSDEGLDEMSVILQTLNELQHSASLISLESPSDALSLATISSELDLPWLVRSNNLDYSAIKEMVRMGLENGSRGLILDSSFLANLNNLAEIIDTEIKDQVLELARIIKEEKYD